MLRPCTVVRCGLLLVLVVILSRAAVLVLPSRRPAVWPWLLGPYLTACTRLRGHFDDHALDALRRYLVEDGVGQIPEIFDGDAPHHPAGCIAQAWSVAEVLRVIVTELHETKPPASEKKK